MGFLDDLGFSHFIGKFRREIDTGYLKKTGDSANNTVAYTSGDGADPTTWTDVALLATDEKHSSILNKVSTMFKNIRYLYKMLGTTDISALGGGTVTGALSALNSNLSPLSFEIIPNDINVTEYAYSFISDRASPLRMKVVFLGNNIYGPVTYSPGIIISCHDVVAIILLRYNNGNIYITTGTESAGMLGWKRYQGTDVT